MFENIGTWGPMALQSSGTLLKTLGFGQAAGANTMNAANARGLAMLQQANYNFQADQIDSFANSAIAVSQREAENSRRVGELSISRLIALAAKSGGGTSGSVLAIAGRLAKESSYKSKIDLYNGDETARQYRMKAAGLRFQGALELMKGNAVASNYESESNANLVSAGATLAGGIGKSLLSKYGGGAPSGMLGPLSDPSIMPSNNPYTPGYMGGTSEGE